MTNPYLRAAARLGAQAALKLEQRHAAELVRARDVNGKFIADDPTTPDVDEAWAKPKKPSGKKP
jgi:hypothetical protein